MFRRGEAFHVNFNAAPDDKPQGWYHVPADHSQLLDVQARMSEEKARLSSIRFKPDHPALQEVASISGQSVGHATSVVVGDLLRKPRINHG